jgi:hypothetical protein
MNSPKDSARRASTSGTASRARSPLDERESEVLRIAAACADDAADLEALVAKGAPVSVRAELRQLRVAQARLLGQLRLPVEDGNPLSNAGEGTQHAARTRWNRTADERDERKAVASGDT